MTFDFFRQFFEKVSNIKFHRNLSSESLVVPCGTDGHDEAKSRFSQFCEARQNIRKVNQNKTVKLKILHEQNSTEAMFSWLRHPDSYKNCSECSICASTQASQKANRLPVPCFTPACLTGTIC
jgi:hypothetical protein